MANPKTSSPSRSAAASPPPVRKKPDQQQILQALDVQVPAVEMPAAYGWALGGLVAFLIFIWILYFGLAVFLAWLFGWHVYQSLASLKHGPYFLFHAPMAILGGTLLLFLVKPVFFRQRGGEEAIVPLKREDEPFLFAFVEKLAQATGAQAPEIIEVDCDPNAAAVPQGRGLFRTVGSKMKLRLGLPLVAGLSVRQIAGVLGHEFGHFNQPSGLAASDLIRRAIAFFAMVVFRRDRLDEKLETWRHSGSLVGRMLFWSLGWLIEAARGVLWLMLVLGEMLCFGVMRRMEYDADRVEAHIAGTADFIRTSKLLMFLAIAAHRARVDLADAWEQHRLANDLPRLIVAHARQLAEFRKDILKHLDEQKTGVFDTHPSHNDRVKNVQAIGADGLVVCDVAAKHLFVNFDELCRRASETLYRSFFGEQFSAAKLIPTAELVEQRAGERKAFAALRRFYQGAAAGTRPIFPTEDASVPAERSEEGSLARELIAARDEMVLHSEHASAAAEQFETSNAAVVVGNAKMALVNVFAFSNRAGKIRREAQRDLQQHEPLRTRAIHDRLEFEKATRRRLTLGLRLVLRRPPQISPPAHVLLSACRDLEPLVDSAEFLRAMCLRLQFLMAGYSDENPYPPLVDKIIETGNSTVDTLKRIKESLAGTPYPFKHAVDGVSIGDALIETIPQGNDPPAIHAASTCAVDRFYDTIYRCLAVLAEQVEQVETALGVDPLPEPPEKKDPAEDEQAAEERRGQRRYWIGYGLRAAGGLAMLTLLITLSLSPPEMPSMGWGRSRNTYGAPTYRYRPAPFRMNFDDTPRYRPTYQPPSFPQPPSYNPRYPNRTDPSRPNYTPPQPYRPPTYTPPQPYRPPNTTPPSRTPSPTPGGGSSGGGSSGSGGRR